MEIRIHPGAVRRESYWVESSRSQLMTHAHLPHHGAARPLAMLICSPLGYEAIHAQRSLAYLADALAESGFLAVRFDYRGTGNASECARAPGLFESWLDNIRDQADSIRDDWGIADICIIGFRFGANLATLGSSALNAERLVLWEPVVRGPAYIREIKATAMSAAGANKPLDGPLESGGFVFVKETLDRIRDCSLAPESLPATTPTLIIARSSTRARIPADIKNRPSCLVVESSEYLEMIAEPHFTALPKRAIRRMLDWLSDAETSGLSERLNGPGRDRSASIRWQGEQLALTETAFRCPDSGLFGVLTEPAGARTARRPLIVLSNAGSVCNIGPNRLYVELSRTLAQEGFSSVRFDLRNLGESSVGDCPEANLPYPETAVADVRDLLAFLRRETPYERFVLSGLCSGAFTSYRAALSDTSRSIAGIVMINPLTFHWTTGMTLINPARHDLVKQARYYDTVMRIGGNWKNLLTGRTQYRRLLRFLAQYSLNRVATGIGRILRMLHLIEESQVAQELAELENAGIFADFVFAETDPGYWILMADAARQVRAAASRGSVSTEFVADADHTFSRSGSRSEMIGRIIRGLDRRYAGRSESAVREPIRELSLSDRSRPQAPPRAG